MWHRYPEPNAPGLIDLTYFPPPTDLCSSFGAAYLFTADKPQVMDMTRADFGQLRLMLSGAGHYHFQHGGKTETPDACLLGPTLGATRFVVDGPLQALGVSILPHGWVSLGLGDASDLSDAVADMAVVLGQEANSLLEKARIMDDPAVGVDAFWSFLRARMKPVPAATVEFIRKCDAWLADEPSPRVEMLLRETGLSARQTARLANRLYGAPPKYLARKYRALRCAADVVLDHHDWIDKVDGTFYDQSHFIREIKHFIGLTPLQLKTDPTPVTRLTMQRRDMIGFVSEINRIS